MKYTKLFDMFMAVNGSQSPPGETATLSRGLMPPLWIKLVLCEGLPTALLSPDHHIKKCSKWTMQGTPPLRRGKDGGVNSDLLLPLVEMVATSD